MTKEEIKSRMKHLARKFCRRNNVYKEFDCSVGKLVEKSYLSAYLLCLHESKNKIAELKKRNAELKGMYAHSAREAGTYKQFLELKENENAELKKQQFSLRNERNTFLAQNEQYEKDLIDFNENLTKAKEIILRLYNAGRDVLMCRSEEKAYDNLSEAINDSNIEQFLKEVSE